MGTQPLLGTNRQVLVATLKLSGEILSFLFADHPSEPGLLLSSTPFWGPLLPTLTLLDEDQPESPTILP